MRVLTIWIRYIIMVHLDIDSSLPQMSPSPDAEGWVQEPRGGPTEPAKRVLPFTQNRNQM